MDFDHGRWMGGAEEPMMLLSFRLLSLMAFASGGPLRNMIQLNSGLVFLAASCVAVCPTLLPRTTFNNGDLGTALLIPSLQCFVLGSLDAVWDVHFVSKWHLLLVFLASYAYVLSIVHQLRKIARFTKAEKQGLFQKRIHPVYIFLLFLWGAIIPVLVPLFWASLIGQAAITAFALALASSFACWLFVDNERTAAQSIDSSLLRVWIFSWIAFGVVAACVEGLSPNPHWFLYCVSWTAFFAISRIAVSVYSTEAKQDRVDSRSSAQRVHL